MSDHPDSAIEAMREALERIATDEHGMQGVHIARAALKDEDDAAERRKIEEAHRDDPESAPSGDRPNGKEAGLPRSDQSGRRGASQSVDGDEWTVSSGRVQLGDGFDPQIHGPAVERGKFKVVRKSRLIAAEQRAKNAEQLNRDFAHTKKRENEERFAEREATEAEKLRQTANANEFQRKWEAAEQRIESLEDDEVLAEVQADRDRLRRENVLVKAQAEGAESMFNELRQERDRLQRELDREKRYNIECEAENADLRHERDAWILNSEAGKAGVSSLQLHDALRALYNALDRYGWCTGRSMESRDTLLAKARAALREERPA